MRFIFSLIGKEKFSTMKMSRYLKAAHFFRQRILSFYQMAEAYFRPRISSEENSVSRVLFL